MAKDLWNMIFRSAWWNTCVIIAFESVNKAHHNSFMFYGITFIYLGMFLESGVFINPYLEYKISIF